MKIYTIMIATDNAQESEVFVHSDYREALNQWYNTLFEAFKHIKYLKSIGVKEEDLHEDGYFLDEFNKSFSYFEDVEQQTIQYNFNTHEV